MKLNASVTTDDFISDFFLTSAGINDRLAVLELIENMSSLKIIADKGYIYNDLKCQLEMESDISLI